METILNNLTVLQLLHVDYSIKNLPKKQLVSTCAEVRTPKSPHTCNLTICSYFNPHNWPESLQNQWCVQTQFELHMCSWMCRTDPRTI